MRTLHSSVLWKRPCNSSSGQLSFCETLYYSSWCKFVCAKPSSLRVTRNQNDSQLIWSGTGSSDTIIWISHQKNEVKVGSYKIDSTGFGDPGFITSTIRWGTMSSSPSITIVKGNYELKRENGKFVSYLKNGEGYHGIDNNKRFYNIEFKVVWRYWLNCFEF